MTNSELVEYYKNLLIIQYLTKDKAPEHIKALMEIIIILELLIDVENGYNIETTVGKQQDIIGKYLGIDRVVTGTDFDRIYFGYVLYGDSAPFDFVGYTQYGNSPTESIFRKYEESNHITIGNRTVNLGAAGGLWGSLTGWGSIKRFGESQDRRI